MKIVIDDMHLAQLSIRVDSKIPQGQQAAVTLNVRHQVFDDGVGSIVIQVSTRIRQNEMFIQ